MAEKKKKPTPTKGTISLMGKQHEIIENSRKKLKESSDDYAKSKVKGAKEKAAKADEAVKKAETDAKEAKVEAEKVEKSGGKKPVNKKDKADK